MDIGLCEAIKKSKSGNDEATMEIINKFRPLIDKYSRKLEYDTASTDLIISLIILIRNIPIGREKLTNDISTAAYIASSIKNQYIRLSKSNRFYKNEIPMTDIVLLSKSEEKIETSFILGEMMDKLSDKQRFIITSIFFYGYTESELAKKMKVSRQAINKTKKKALKTLKKYLCA